MSWSSGDVDLSNILSSAVGVVCITRLLLSPQLGLFILLPIPQLINYLKDYNDGAEEEEWADEIYDRIEEVSVVGGGEG